MFTTINKLRASSAIQSRVDLVENSLKKINPNWHGNYLIPVPYIALTNNVDDANWVASTSSVIVQTELDDEIQSIASQQDLSNWLGKARRNKADAIGKYMNIVNSVLQRRGLSDNVLTEPVVATGRARLAKVEATKMPPVPLEGLKEVEMNITVESKAAAEGPVEEDSTTMMRDLLLDTPPEVLFHLLVEVGDTVFGKSNFECGSDSLTILNRPR
jgi:hypothetical protein